jgi:adenosylcobyric acid synthase
VIAQIVGTQAVMDGGDNARVAGFMINKFRGDPSLFDDGYQMITGHTGWRGFGVVPWFADAWRLPAEDALDIRSGPQDGAFKVVCLALSRIANFDDMDPLAQEPNVSLVMLKAGEVIPADADLVIIPGSKSTRGDLAFLRAQGWDVDLAAHHRRGGHVLGICGGYQMLGQLIRDPEGIEGVAGDSDGLGLLEVETQMIADKRLTIVNAVHADTDLPFEGYEIHIGRTEGCDTQRPFAFVDGQPEGAQSGDGRVMGSYLHGMFANDAWRAAFLNGLGAQASGGQYSADVEQALDDLADHVETYLDVSGLISTAH